MNELDYLNYTNNPPFSNVLFELAKQQPLNFEQLHRRLARTFPNFSKNDLESVLMELKYKGIVIEINGCFLIAEEWMRELILFLHELEALENDIASVSKA